MEHVIQGEAGQEGVAAMDGDDNAMRGETTEQGLGVVESTDADGDTEGEVEEGREGAPVFVGVDEVVEEMPVRAEAVANQPAGLGGVGVGEEDVGGNGYGVGGEGNVVGAAPAEEGEEEAGVGAEVRESTEEVVGADAVSEWSEDGVDGIGVKPLLEGGCEAEDELGVSDARLLR